ncbi:MAG: signal peptidase II [Bombilactobacillus mellifer]|nr:signal peptidase II [Bombilactobacillus mellifer]
MNNKIKTLIIGLILFFDQLLKYMVVQFLKPGQEKILIKGIVSLTNVKNSGAAWSIGEGKTWIFILVTIIFIPFAGYFLYIKKIENIWFNWGLALILGGTLGNFLDRIINHQVVDMIMIKFFDFPIFNLADIAINIGVLCLVVYLFKSGKEAKQ